MEEILKTISPEKLQLWIASATPFQLIDVREEEEHAAFNIGGTLIPLDNIVRAVDQIDTEIPVVFYCRKGIRSAIAIQRIQNKFPFANLYNLTGGIEAWKIFHRLQ
ncbi:MAG: rhodanese-like domain-containing protein [Ferruginibacter sp.]